MASPQGIERRVGLARFFLLSYVAHYSTPMMVVFE